MNEYTLKKYVLTCIILLVILFKSHEIKGQEVNVLNQLIANQPYPTKIVNETEYDMTGHISDKNGKLINSPSNYLSTNFIETSVGNIIECRLPPSKCGGLAFYDANKQYLSSISSENGGIIKVEIPQKAFYVRLCKRTDLAGIIYYAKFYKSNKEEKSAILQKIHDGLQNLSGGLYAALIPNYIIALKSEDFAYNQLDKNGIPIIDPNVKELFYPILRIPIHLKTKHGTIIIAAEAKRKDKEFNGNSIVIARSINGGQTFEKRYLCEGYNPCMVYDEKNDCIFFLHGLTYSTSTDDGQTWSNFKPMEIEKPKGWEKFYASPTTGIQLTNGILAAPYILMNGSGKGITKNANVVVFSRDFGKTWQVTATTPDTIIANEATIAEYTTNQIMINSRGGTEAHWKSDNPGRRIFIPVISSKNKREDWLISKWESHKSDKQLIEPICNASFISCIYGKHHFGLFCNPHTKMKARKNLILQVTSDFTHWTKVGLLTPYDREVYGYCSLNYQNGNLSFVFEDKECGILYADITPLMDEILTKMIVNKMIYEYK